MDSISMMIDIC